MELILHFMSITLYFGVKFSSCTQLGTDVLPIFNILLGNLITCDIQILHDGSHLNIDWFNINLPTKLVNMSGFKYWDHVKTRLDIFKTRSSPYSKFAIFISQPYHQAAGENLNHDLNLDNWISSATDGHLNFKKVLSDTDDHMFSHMMQCKDIVVAFVATQNYRKNLVSVHFSSHLYHKISVVLISRENLNVEVCAWSHVAWNVSLGISNLSENLRCTTKRKSAILDTIEGIVHLSSPRWCCETQIKKSLSN